ncbi:YjcQ family protein [Treponema vincentii]|uniref:YjcQ family protein n=1 Tax=Treponema vincentii TaxID=69710 RepID=UPI003D8FDCBF
MAIKNKTTIFFIQRTSFDSIARERQRRKGLQYLAENIMMVRMWNAFKTVKEVKDTIVP